MRELEWRVRDFRCIGFWGGKQEGGPTSPWKARPNQTIIVICFHRKHKALRRAKQDAVIGGNAVQHRVHIRDMISIGLIDATWLERFSPQLRSRLHELLDNPDG